MKKFTLFLFIFSVLQLSAQNNWLVLAGGTPASGTPAPYYSPSLLTIQVGDTVVWENIEGFHDVTTTSGPEDFSLEPAGTGWTHQFVFTQAGVYNYECSVGTHAETQFGTITVVEDQTKYVVVAGGTPSADTPDPYYSPSLLTIQVGDTVIWENIEGFHDVTTTSGPEDFSYEPAGTGWTHEYVFTVAGEYDYECSVGDHSLTQFGTITVEDEMVSTNDPTAIPTQVQLYPNPVKDNLTVEWDNNDWHTSNNPYILLIDVLGAEKLRRQISPGQRSINLNLSDFSSGVYIISIETDAEKIWSQQIIRE